MALVVNDRLRTTSVVRMGVVRVMCAVHSCRLNFGRCLDSTSVGVAASKTGHEGWFCGSGLDHSVVAAGMHVERFFWSCFGVCGWECSC